MIQRIAKKEITELLREGRIRVMSITVLALSVVAAVVSYNYYCQVNSEHLAASENARNVWVSQDNKNPHSAAHYGTYAFKPKYPMSLIDQGIDKYAGTSIYLEAHKRNEAQYLVAQDQTAMARFGDLTPDFILLFIVPLFIILTGFNAFTREKESSTLRILRAQGVPDSSLTIGKWLGISSSVMIIVLPVTIIVAVLLSLAKDFGSFSLPSYLLLVAFYAIYYAIFVNITLAVSALAKTSNSALVSLLAVWIVVCLAMPKAANLIADAVHPYPTQNEFAASVVADEKQGFDGHDPFDTQAQKLEKEILKEYRVDSVQQLPFNWDGFLMQKGEEHTAEIYFRHHEKLREINTEQTGVYRIASVLSPYLPTRFLSMALCRTDYHAHWDFGTAAEKYRLMMMDKLNMHFAENSQYGDWDYQADKSLWTQIPDFSYTPLTYEKILQTNLSNILVLLLWFILSSAMLMIIVSKMKTF